MPDTSGTSWNKYNESLKYLAGGSSTSSKRPRFEDSEPALIVSGKGCRVTDADGNEYLDFRSGLGPVSLGYGNPAVNSAIRKQLHSGIVFGHPHPLEGEVAELLVREIPCAEKVRFLKTGGEAVAACIKTARAITGRDSIIHCGYNGWLNSLSASTSAPRGISSESPSKGVPGAVASLHTSLPWGDAGKWREALKSRGGQTAAVVIACEYESMEIGSEFLPEIRTLTEKHGTLMVMDEIVTGFRLATGGAHEYFKFAPDMAVFSKGMANGMPISAYTGKSELMESTKKIGISSTFGGEALSLAAAKATIEFYRDNDVIGHLWTTGKFLRDGMNKLLEKHGFPGRLKGLPVCPRFSFADDSCRESFFRSCFREGLSLYDNPYVTFSHKKKDIEQALVKADSALGKISGKIRDKRKKYY